MQQEENQHQNQPPSPAAGRFVRTEGERVERLFDEICGLKMSELRSLTDILCARLSLRVVGSFAAVLERAIPAPAEPLGVRLSSLGTGSRVEAMKAAKAIMGFGLKEARDFVEGLPRSLEPAETPEEARALAQRWTEAGFVAELV